MRPTRMTPDVTFSDLANLDADTREAAKAFQMDEDAFRAFYDRTSRPVWAYLARMTGDTRLADDLLQESYYRFLRAAVAFEDEAHRRNYLFRIATNLVQDARRRRPADALQSTNSFEALDEAGPGDVATQSALRIDVRRAMARLTLRERSLLWLAYANGASHQEIARSLGLKTSSIKMLLHRARRRLAALLTEGSRG
jgi:RNA polymerase sigma-70 factor, ECF subfamily